MKILKEITSEKRKEEKAKCSIIAGSSPPPALPELKKKEVKDDIPQVKNEKYAIANVEKTRERRYSQSILLFLIMKAIPKING